MNEDKKLLFSVLKELDDSPYKDFPYLYSDREKIPAWEEYLQGILKSKLYIALQMGIRISGFVPFGWTEGELFSETYNNEVILNGWEYTKDLPKLPKNDISVLHTVNRMIPRNYADHNRKILYHIIAVIFGFRKSRLSNGYISRQDIYTNFLKQYLKSDDSCYQKAWNLMEHALPDTHWTVRKNGKGDYPFLLKTEWNGNTFVLFTSYDRKAVTERKRFADHLLKTLAIVPSPITEITCG
ncbi:hypothetical protein [Candidatus Ruminimicrobium bovinum]|uniref:hypothetical protein n=1 Tax=Candidatus Ruminimicrobium bovinum TaxID=3242779 RepID=UPI0039B8CC88